MLAAVTGLVYTVGNLLRLEGYLAYGLPLPIVLAALRSGPLPALKTLTVAVLLLLSERKERAGGEGASAAGNVARCGNSCAVGCLLDAWLHHVSIV